MFMFVSLFFFWEGVLRKLDDISMFLFTLAFVWHLYELEWAYSLYAE